MPLLLKIEDFALFPGGRDRSDGDWSGQQFREEVLTPALSEVDEISVDLRGAKILLPSFLDEAFGPLIEDLGKKEFLRRVKIVYEKDSDVEDNVLETIRLRG
ncbi:MAG: STAS-like domain-containing protein [Verrucomicrobiota bacterium]